MAETYRAVFTCPEYEEREVWYVSSRTVAKLMLARHIRTEASSSIQGRYKRAEYTFTVEPVFESTGDASYDPRP
jgi:hypothetical protein